MIVVSDASPLIALARVKRVELLQPLFGRLIVPEAVWREVALSGMDKAGSSDFAQADWIQTCAVSDLALVASLECSSRHGNAV